MNHAVEVLVKKTQIITVSATVLVMSVSIPVGSLKVEGSLLFCDFATLFLIPVLCLGAVAFLVQVKGQKNFQLLALILTGVCEGTAIGAGLLSLATAYFWYQSPNLQHLEPLFVVLGLNAGTATMCYKKIESIVPKMKEYLGEEH